MPVHRKEEDSEEKRVQASGSFVNFMQKSATKEFVESWHEKGYTKAGVEELLYELYQRYASDGDDDDEDAVLGRAGEMLEIMKSVRGLFEPFKDKAEKA